MFHNNVYREIHLKKSLTDIPPDFIFYIELEKVIFRPRECVSSHVPNIMVN